MNADVSVFKIYIERGVGVIWYSTPFTTIFQLYHGSQFYSRRKPGYPEKTINLSLVTDKPEIGFRKFCCS
jgi:hypothetical protein